MSRMTSLFASVQATNRRIAPPPGGSPPPPPPPSQFDDYWDSSYVGWTPYTNTSTLVSRPTPSKPAKGSSITHATFGGITYRVTNSATEINSGLSHCRNVYAKQLAFACDNSKFFVVTSDSWWHAYDATPPFAHIDGGRTGSGGMNGALLGVSGSDCDLFPHPTDPDKVWYTADLGGLLWYELTISTGNSTTLFNFTGRLSAIGMGTGARVYMGGEGRPSADGRYWCFMVKSSGGTMLGIFDYDRDTDTILSSVLSSTAPNWTGMDITGAYSVVQWHNFAGLSHATTHGRTVAQNPDGTRAFPRGGLAGSTWVTLDNSGEHGDLVLDKLGNSAWVSASYSPTSDVGDGTLYYKRLDTGVAYANTIPDADGYGGIDYAMHFCGAGKNRPGWAVITYEAGGGSVAGWRDGCMILYELTPTSPRMIRVTHHQSNASTYWASPLACCNADITRIMHSGDWRGADTQFEGFMTVLPSDWDTR